MKLKCIHVTNGLRLYNDGTAMLCCMSRNKLTNKNGDVASIKNVSIDEIRYGKKAIEIKDALASGIRHENCERCWREEAGGIESKRIRDNKQFSYNDESLRIIELNLGTTCNLKCRICGPWSSSQWNKEYIELDRWNNTKESYKIWLYDLNHSYDDDSLFWEEIEEYLSTLKHIEIYGGEPFMVRKQWGILKYSVEQGYSKDQTVNFNTNGTHYDEEKIEIMKNFNNINISFSLDGIHKRFEYQRHPAKWNEVYENLLNYIDVANRYNWDLSVCITVNNYNIFYLIETLEFFRNLRLNIYLNFLHDPAMFSVHNLPDEIKINLTNTYKNYSSFDPTVNFWLSKAVEYINSKSANNSEWNDFLSMTRKLDVNRGEDFKSIFPEFYSIINDL